MFVCNTRENVFVRRYADKMEAASSLNKLKSLVLGIQKGLSTVLAFGVLGLGFWSVSNDISSFNKLSLSLSNNLQPCIATN